ncbi:MAG: acyl carrier protein [Bacteroidales bacterium]|jgi:acyl carrier protein|nr:acyl carrier protein [Bacteroidales bacterium]
MKERIKSILESALPMVDIEEDYLFSQLDSLGVTTMLMLLSEEFNISLDASDATPKNLRNLDSITNLVQSKLS